MSKFSLDNLQDRGEVAWPVRKINNGRKFHQIIGNCKMWEDGYQVKGSDLELGFKVAGSGSNLLICLHGYGQDRHAFDAIAALVQPGWRIICPDLPGFGQSRFMHPKQILQPASLLMLVEWAEQSGPVDRLVLAGYSLGGKTALGIAMHSHRPVHGVLLMAPDGLKLHPVYRFCVYNPFGRIIFHLTLRYPFALLLCLRMLIFLRKRDNFKYRLAEKQLRDARSRLRIRQVWEGYSGFGPDRGLVQAATQKWGIRWKILWGSRDKVVPAHFGAEFAVWLPEAQFHLLDGGHALLKDCVSQSAGFWNDFLRKI